MGIAAQDAVMIEDTVANLQHPKAMSMQTLLIGTQPSSMRRTSLQSLWNSFMRIACK
ncbi:MAG: hypothetical protein ACOYNL_09965 [Rickettsiales bacterium]